MNFEREREYTYLFDFAVLLVDELSDTIGGGGGMRLALGREQTAVAQVGEVEAAAAAAAAVAARRHTPEHVEAVELALNVGRVGVQRLDAAMKVALDGDERRAAGAHADQLAVEGVAAVGEVVADGAREQVDGVRVQAEAVEDVGLAGGRRVHDIFWRRTRRHSRSGRRGKDGRRRRRRRRRELEECVTHVVEHVVAAVQNVHGAVGVDGDGDRIVEAHFARRVAADKDLERPILLVVAAAACRRLDDAHSSRRWLGLDVSPLVLEHVELAVDAEGHVDGAAQWPLIVLAAAAAAGERHADDPVEGAASPTHAIDDVLVEHVQAVVHRIHSQTRRPMEAHARQRHAHVAAALQLQRLIAIAIVVVASNDASNGACVALQRLDHVAVDEVHAAVVVERHAARIAEQLVLATLNFAVVIIILELFFARFVCVQVRVDVLPARDEAKVGAQLLLAQLLLSLDAQDGASTRVAHVNVSAGGRIARHVVLVRELLHVGELEDASRRWSRRFTRVQHPHVVVVGDEDRSVAADRQRIGRVEAELVVAVAVVVGVGVGTTAATVELASLSGEWRAAAAAAAAVSVATEASTGGHLDNLLRLLEIDGRAVAFVQYAVLDVEAMVHVEVPVAQLGRGQLVAGQLHHLRVPVHLRALLVLVADHHFNNQDHN